MFLSKEMLFNLIKKINELKKEMNRFLSKVMPSIY